MCTLHVLALKLIYMCIACIGRNLTGHDRFSASKDIALMRNASACNSNLLIAAGAGAIATELGVREERLRVFFGSVRGCRPAALQGHAGTYI